MSCRLHTALRWSRALTAVVLLALVGVTAASATDIYVSTTGTDPVGCVAHPNGGAPYLTIQKAVGCASSGDVIHIGAGTYEEQVVVTTSNLILDGAGVGTTIIKSPVTLTTFFSTGLNNYPVVFVNGATNVTVQNVTVDGAGRGNSNYRFQGVAYWNGGGKLANAAVIGVRDTPLGGAQHGVAIYAYNNTAGPYTLEIANVTVTDFQKNAMALNGNGNLTVDVHDCTTTGAGATSVTAQNGIQIWGASGSVTDCSIADVDFTGSGWTASGLLLIGPGTVTASGTNPITNCQAAIYAQDVNADIGGVDISGSTTWGAYFYNTSISKAGLPSSARAGTPPAAAPFDAEEISKATLPRLQASLTASLHDGCLTGPGTSGTEGIDVYSAGGPLAVSLSNLEISAWEYGIVVYDAVSSVTANDNSITGNLTAGFDNTTASGPQNAEWNWWGAANGPSGAGTGSGDAVLGTGVDFVSWRNSGTDLQPGCGFLPPTDTVGPVAPDSCLSTVDSCVTVAFDISRLSTDNMRGFSVTFTLSPELQLCGGLGSIVEGAYLSGSTTAGTQFQVLDNGGGSYTVDCAILGIPCGATAATGNLFNVDVKKTGVDGTGTVTVTSVTLRNCSNGAIAGEVGPPVAITIDNAGPAAVADLAASQVKTGNDTDGTTKITLTFTAPGDASVVEVYRAGFGNYPEYDDAPGAGSVPATPSYPPGGPWALTTVTATGQTDEVATPRDFWYYVVFTKDACGNVSAVSNKTGGTLNYHLGDVMPSGGDNDVNTADISNLGFNYGLSLGVSDALAYLDVGPTTDYSVDARPTTDNVLQFEDLIMFAINYGTVSKSRTDVVPAASDQLVLLTPDGAAKGATFTAHLWARGTGRIQGLSARLSWNAKVVEPVGIEAGDLLHDLGGVAFTPAPGVVDVALLGVGSLGLAGEGDLATVRFRVIGDGDPEIALASVDGRDAANHRIDVNGGTTEPAASTPRVTAILANVPNPFNPTTRIPYSLAADGSVDLAIYTVDGRLVRTLFSGARAAGLYESTWNGTDERGERVSSGVYYARLVTRDGSRSRPIVLLK